MLVKEIQTFIAIEQLFAGTRVKKQKQWYQQKQAKSLHKSHHKYILLGFLTEYHRACESQQRGLPYMWLRSVLIFRGPQCMWSRLILLGFIYFYNQCLSQQMFVRQFYVRLWKKMSLDLSLIMYLVGMVLYGGDFLL